MSGRDFGRRLIPQVIDEIAQRDPQRECFSIARSSRPEDGWEPITFKQYSNAINRVSHMIVERCGHPPANVIPTLAYIGPNDARYVIILVAAVKAGYKALFLSPRNPYEAQMNLLDKADCHFICFPDSHRVVTKPWLDNRNMVVVEAGTLDSWLSSHEAEPFPYSKTFEQVEWDPFVVLHTSGSTGLPKPVEIRHGMLAISDAYHVLPDYRELPSSLRVWSEGPKRQFAPFPLFHAGGIYLFLARVVYWSNPVAFGIVDRLLSPDLVVDCLNNVDVGGILVAPATLEQMSSSDHYIEAMSKLNMVIFGGGSLNKEAGNKLSGGGVKLVNTLGATEFSPPPIYVHSNPDLWQYFVVDSDMFGAEWRQEIADDGEAYRLVLVRKGDNPGYQACFYTFPDKQEYDTGDLFQPHPTLPDYWAYAGRSDGIIVLSNGEKLNPVTIEEHVERHPLVKGALVIGSGRFQAGLLIEPLQKSGNDDEERQLLDSIWLSVEEVNKMTVAHGQISRRLILLSDPQKPLPRGGKGAIQRRNTLSLYRYEIDQLYSEEDTALNKEVIAIDAKSEHALMKSIQHLFQIQLEGREASLDADTDIFLAGIDSLQILNTYHLLRSSLDAAGYHVNITPQVIYSNPTLRRLSTRIYSMLRDAPGSTMKTDDSETEAMEAAWKKHIQNISKPQHGRKDALDEGQTIILTGSTGNMGSYLLDLLMKSPAVRRVICLNRSEDGGAKKQEQAMKERGLASPSSGPKVAFLHANVSKPYFGLGPTTYNELLRDTDRIIHNAWPVNFNMPFESFEPQFQGLHNIASFASEASKRVMVVFISSVGAVQGWDSRNEGSVPEERLERMALASKGYGQSKMIGSLIIEDTAKSGDFPAAIIRMGQIAGPEADAGSWAKHELIPSIVASSLYLKALPRDLAHFAQVDWVPAERSASAVLEIAGVSQKILSETTCDYFHVVNPTTVPWTDLAQATQEFYGKHRIPELISFHDWVARLEKSGERKEWDQNPGLKLLDTLRTMSSANDSVVLDTQKAVARSRSLRTMSAITPQMMKHWCKQWAF
ncbi:hypothetical protein GGR52DRAFT_555036 [Hypoxylon sp. FL1284]|nr:hypothetical protein GGR52DRAFT_555036 [Hypoxylon sp. FL1284]